MVVTTQSEAQTLTLGRRLGRLLKGYDVVCLDGDLRPWQRQDHLD
jgi:tRNA A37 threonylcarbamoyladenosine biosynthesis protein TsaE